MIQLYVNRIMLVSNDYKSMSILAGIRKIDILVGYSKKLKKKDLFYYVRKFKKNKEEIHNAKSKLCINYHVTDLEIIKERLYYDCSKWV